MERDIAAIDGLGMLEGQQLGYGLRCAAPADYCSDLDSESVKLCIRNQIGQAGLSTHERAASIGEARSSLYECQQCFPNSPMLTD